VIKVVHSLRKDEMGRSSLGHMRNEYKILVGRYQGRDHVRGLGINERIMLKQFLGKWSVKVG
jgi:hypothetical protein